MPSVYSDQSYVALNTDDTALLGLEHDDDRDLMS